MALLPSEILRIKRELGYNLLTIGSEPYISYVSLFDGVILPYLSSGATTTSVTAVTATTLPTPHAFVLTSAVGFDAGAIVVIDVDSRQERVTVQSMAGDTITVLSSLVHSGTYPVTVEGGESMVREILNELTDISTRIGAAVGRAGLKRVEDIEFFEGGGSVFSSLQKARNYWRDELAAILGVARLNGTAGGGSFEVY